MVSLLMFKGQNGTGKAWRKWMYEGGMPRGRVQPGGLWWLAWLMSLDSDGGKAVLANLQPEKEVSVSKCL